MRVLVFGGAGFIGSHLTRALLDAGHRVMVADNLKTAHSLDLVGRRAGADFVHLDVRCPEDFLALPGGPFERVYHLAASYANALSVENPKLDERTNVEGTLHVLEYCRRVGTGLLVFTGSSSSYGDAPLPFDEEGPMRPQTPYALHKHVAEWHVRNSGIPWAVFRLFNAYGPGDPPGPYRNVIPNMLVAAAAPEGRVRVTGEAATRDFNYVEDVIRVLADPERAQGRTLNVGSGVETHIVDLARRVLVLFDLPEHRMIVEPPRSWDGVTRRCAAVTRLKELYGEVAPTSLDAGLRATATWLFEHGFAARGPS